MKWIIKRRATGEFNDIQIAELTVFSQREFKGKKGKDGLTHLFIRVEQRQHKCSHVLISREQNGILFSQSPSIHPWMCTFTLLHPCKERYLFLDIKKWTQENVAPPTDHNQAHPNHIIIIELQLSAKGRQLSFCGLGDFHCAFPGFLKGSSQAGFRLKIFMQFTSFLASPKIPERGNMWYFILWVYMGSGKELSMSQSKVFHYFTSFTIFLQVPSWVLLGTWYIMAINLSEKLTYHPALPYRRACTLFEMSFSLQKKVTDMPHLALPSSLEEDANVKLVKCYIARQK